MFTGDITVTQKVPDSITQGKEAIVEITISKGNLPGFAKIQQVFPGGFTAEPIETKGATFSFKDDKVKFIWMALPVAEEFTISYKIIPNENTAGNFTLGGKFSFISESERKNLAIPVASFTVGTEELVADITPDKISEEVTEDPIVEEKVVEAAVKEPVLKKSKIICKRTIESLGKRKYKVTIEINKDGIEGFAKLTEDIPEGFSASKNDSKGGAFSFKENTAKMLWLAIPNGDKYTIVYNLEANSKTLNGTYKIKGDYAYLENDITSKYSIDESVFDLNEDPESIIEEIVEEVPLKKPVVKEIIEESVGEDNSSEITSTPNPENGVAYKVQVGAGHKTVKANYFKTRFNLKDNVSTMNHEGWIKYLVGSFNEYKIARDKRNKVRNNVKTAFVTAYNSGTRITVQEALMISNQKWYK